MQTLFGSGENPRILPVFKLVHLSLSLNCAVTRPETSAICGAPTVVAFLVSSSDGIWSCCPCCTQCYPGLGDLLMGVNHDDS